MKIVVLGSAQDAGIPQIACHCDACKRAVEDKSFQRLPACIAVLDDVAEQAFVIDAPLTLDRQLRQLENLIGQSDSGSICVDAMLLTHAHLGHYPGILSLGREALNTNHFPVYASNGMIEFLKQNRPFSHLIERGQIEPQPFETDVEVSLTEHLSVLPIEVEHRNEDADTHAFVFSQSGKKALYVPDLDRWTSSLIEAIADVDVAIVDGSFYSMNELPASRMKVVAHPPIHETMDILDPYCRDTQILFTHFNHTNPVIDPNSKQRRLLQERGYGVVKDHQIIEL
jgi:pyrroloquinoline quinone biosynthesis protein B